MYILRNTWDVSSYNGSLHEVLLLGISPAHDSLLCHIVIAFGRTMIRDRQMMIGLALAKITAILILGGEGIQQHAARAFALRSLSSREFGSQRQKAQCHAIIHCVFKLG